ncbi:MAG: hypothetical protein ACYTEX_26515, partial [Planctomycetota bacterium]
MDDPNVADPTQVEHTAAEHTSWLRLIAKLELARKLKVIDRWSLERADDFISVQLHSREKTRVMSFGTPLMRTRTRDCECGKTRFAERVPLTEAQIQDSP